MLTIFWLYALALSLKTFRASTFFTERPDRADGNIHEYSSVHIMHFVDDDRLEQDRDAAGSCDSSGQFALCEMDAFSVVKVCCCNDNRHLQVFDPFGRRFFFRKSVK